MVLVGVAESGNVIGSTLHVSEEGGNASCQNGRAIQEAGKMLQAIAVLDVFAVSLESIQSCGNPVVAQGRCKFGSRYTPVRI